MNVLFTPTAQEDFDFWVKTNPKIVKRIEHLIEDIQKTPFTGIGKPELLKHDKSGYWSRRITSEHRLVYKIAKDTLFVVQCRFHY